MGNPRKPSGSKGGGGAAEEPLHAAARAGDLATVQAICSSNTLALNSRDRHSRTPLHLAAWAGHTNVVSYLCKNNADVGAAAMDDMGAIHFASQKGHLEVVRILVSSGVSLKAATRKGFTPLHYAAQGSHLELTRYLLRRGANIVAKTKAGKTPRDLAESDEVRSHLKECEKDPDKLNPSATQKSGSSQHHHRQPKDEEENEKETSLDNVGEDGKSHEMDKRKGDETETGDDKTHRVQKKPRVALNHLLAETDTQEEEE